MTVTMNNPQYLAPRTWRISWTSDASSPTFYVYRDGVLIATQAEAEITITVEPDESPVITVLDAAPTAANTPETHPGHVTLVWSQPTSGADVDYYKIEEYVSAAWTERKRIVDDGRTYYRWVSRFLEDGQTHQFRVRAVGVNGNDSTIETLSALIVRYPDPPEVDLAFDEGTAKVTVTAA